MQYNVDRTRPKQIPITQLQPWEQTVEHVLMRCALAEDARGESMTRLGMVMDVTTLLYSQEGIEETAKIWGESEKARKEIRERQGERVEAEEREWEWGWGDVER